MQHHRPKRRLAPLLVVLVAATGCAARSRAATPKSNPTTTASAPSTTAGDPRDGAAIDGYRAFWADYIAAGDPIQPDSPRLRAHATGKELDHVVSAFLAYQTAGEVLRGTIDLAPVVVARDTTTITLRDCYASHILGYDAKTGQPKGSGRQDRTLVTVKMTEDTGVWKVADLTHESDGCLTAG